eukprot:jgi/Hompol1/2610/HPOL_006121-RA
MSSMHRPQRTGTNDIPLGPRKRALDPGSASDQPQYGHFDSHGTPSGYDADLSSNSLSSRPFPTDAASSDPVTSLLFSIDKEPDQEREGRQRKRPSRWGSEHSKINVPGMPTALPAGLTPEQLESYTIHMRLEEINRNLRSGDYVPADKRSVSPPPEYGADGRRTNTREVRYKKKLEDERHKLVEKALKIIPGFKPPADYRRPTKMVEKIYVPTRDFPEINFIGLLIGPRGNTLKKIEAESGCKISLRGKGSVKEGRGRPDNRLQIGEEEDLHCLIAADQEEKVRRGVEMINKIIETATSVPEAQNDLKRNQLRELAALNGTLRDDENQVCINCGGVGHRKYECPEQRNFTANLRCRICDGVGHIARDCMQRNNPAALQEATQNNQRMDSEISSLMAEIGTNPHDHGNSHSHGQGRRMGGPGHSAGGGGAAPWARSNDGGGGAAP